MSLIEPIEPAAALEVRNLVTELRLRRGTLRPVDGVSFSVAKGQTLGIVGESGSGKSMTCLSLLRRPGGRIAGGEVVVAGTDLTKLSDRELARDWRGRRISMVTQDPMSSLNPVYTIGDQVGAPLRYHRIARTRSDARARAAEALGKVRIPSPEARLRAHVEPRCHHSGQNDGSLPPDSGGDRRRHRADHP